MNRSSAGIARITVALGVVAALIAAVAAFLLTGDDEGTTELFLEPAASSGPDPFTESVVTDDVPASPPETGVDVLPVAPEDAPGAVGGVEGDTPGLYGGTGRAGECDVEKLVEFLTTNKAKGRAWAKVQGISFNELPDYLRGLTPVILTVDTRVTNHGFRDGKATPRQSVLQAGTAVLVDDRGVPRARCACGNPLLEPEALDGARTVGEPWDGYEPEQAVRVVPGETDLETLDIVCTEAPAGGELPTAEGVLQLYVGRWSNVPVPSGFEERTNVARVTVLVDTSNIGVAGNIAFAPSSGGPATDEWAIVGNALGDLTPGSPTEFPDGVLSEFDESPASGDPVSTEPLALTVTVVGSTANGSAANGMTFVATLALEHDLAEGVIPSEFTDLLGGIPGLDLPAAGAPAAEGGALPVECLDGEGEAPDEPEPSAPLTADGEFTSYPGAPPSTPSPNRVSLTVPAGGGPVSGESEWAVETAGGATTVTGVWSGTYDPATGELSGTAQITTTGPDGQVLGSGTADWSGTYDPATGLVEGTLESDDGPWAFTASTGA